MAKKAKEQGRATDPTGLKFEPIYSQDLADIGIPGVVVEVSREEAESLGAFEETALSADDAWDSLDMPADNRPVDWTAGNLSADANSRLNQWLSDMAAKIDAGGIIEDFATNFLFTLLPEAYREMHKATVDRRANEKVSAREKRIRSNQDSFLADCAAMEAESAKEAGALGYMARVLVQATMPHSRKDATHFMRTNGSLTVEIAAGSQGLPYGSYPRLLLAWLTTEAVRTQSPTLYLGDSLSQFMHKLDLLPTGGRWGTIPRLREQAVRLFHSFVTAYNTHGTTGRGGERGGNIMVADDWDLWWDARDIAQQGALFSSWVKLTEKFYSQVTDRPVPVDLRAIKALKKSPLALDLYAWTTYRMSYLSQRTEIPWEALQMQFGSDYASDAKGRRNFKGKLLDALKKVAIVYPELRARDGDSGLLLLPSPTHIRRINK